MRLLVLAIIASAHAAPSRIVFPDSPRQEKRLEPITPPVLPVIPHLENDPTASRKGETVSRNAVRDSVEPRLGFNHGFDVSPNGDGGLTASFSSGYTGLAGNSQSAAQSVSFGFNSGFQASQSSSSSSAFSNAALGGSGSQANSQAASFSVGSGGVSAVSAAASAAAANGQATANSQSASFGANSPNFGGNSPNSAGHSAAGSQSSSSAFGTGSAPRPSGLYRPDSYAAKPGFSSGNPGLSRPNFGEGSIDVRTRPVSGVAATSIVFPGGVSRDVDDDDSEELFEDRWLTGGRRGGLEKWLSILVSD